ncbi:MAG: PAS domain S-box protein, partial [Bacteroidia bacterium]|nr:PAS domain S-box protein [Bacteroidia bacterium]
MPFRKSHFFNVSWVTVIAVFLAILIGLMTLMGWIFNVEALKTFNPNWPVVKANSAIGIIFSGISLYLFILKKNRPALFLATIVFLVGIVTLGEHLFPFNAHIDELLFTDNGTSIDKHHGRMARLTAMAVAMIGVSLLFYSYKRKWAQRLSVFSAILVLLMSFGGFIGALYNAGRLFRAANIASFSVPTALSGLLMSVGILFSKPDIGFLATFYRKTAAAKAGIKGIVIIITILLAIGWLCLKGEDAGLFDREMGFVIMILTFTIFFLFIVWSGVLRLNRGEDQLTASEKNLRYVLSSTADIFYVIDRNYHIILINGTAEKILTKAWGNKVSMGVNILDLIPDENNEPIRESFKKVFAGEKIEYEFHQSLEDIPEWFLVSYKPVIDSDGTVIGAYVVTKDITERKKTEDELRKSEEKYRTIIEQAPDGIFMADRNFFITDANDYGCRMVGYSKEELQKMKFTEIVSPENMRENPIKLNELNSGKIIVNDRRLIRKDGSEILVEIRAKLISDDLYQSVIRDITDRVKVEAKLIEQERLLRLFVEHSPAALAMFDDNMRYIIASRRWRTDYHLGDQNITGKSHYDVFPDISQNWKEIHRRCLTGATEESEEDSFIRADGSVDWVHWEIHPWYKASGNVGGIIMFTEVTTDRKKAKDALEESEARYKALVDNAPEALVVMDLEKRKFISVSESATKLFRMTEQVLLDIGPLEVSPEYQPDGRLSSEAIIENLN